MASKKTGVDPRVVAAVRAWAAAGVDGAARVLEDERRRLDPSLLPSLIEEVAEITAEQLFHVLELPSPPPAPDERPVELFGVQLTQAQGTRAAGWLMELPLLARALGLTEEQWGRRLQQGLASVFAALRGRAVPGLGADAPAAVSLAPGATAPPQASDALAQALIGSEPRGLVTPADPSTSEKAGLRGALAARQFRDPRKPPR